MKTKRKILVAFILNLTFALFELVGGFLTGSVAIFSDAVHDFGDAAGIGTAYFLEKKREKEPNEKYTYGYARFPVLGGLLNTCILLISSGIVIWSAILRIINPRSINYNGVLLFALFGVVVNFIAAYVTHGGKSVNQKAVNLHMLEDVLGWLVVLLGAILMKFTNWYIIDPILSIGVSIFILTNCVKNLRQIGELFLMKTPKNISISKLTEHIEKIDGVMGVHHIHIWSIDGEIHCASLHLVLQDFDEKIKGKVKEELKEHGISHIVIEMESPMQVCDEMICDINRHTHVCNHCHHH